MILLISSIDLDLGKVLLSVVLYKYKENLLFRNTLGVLF